jgi:hypothetical protein
LEPCGADPFGAPSKKNDYWHLQNLGDLLQPACPDAVRALLVYLQLLEREDERVAPAGDGPSRNLFVDGALPSGVKPSTRTAAAEVCG